MGHLMWGPLYIMDGNANYNSLRRRETELILAVIALPGHFICPTRPYTYDRIYFISLPLITLSCGGVHQFGRSVVRRRSSGANGNGIKSRIHWGILWRRTHTHYACSFIQQQQQLKVRWVDTDRGQSPFNEEAVIRNVELFDLDICSTNNA